MKLKEKYHDIEMSFKEYYKYSFTYVGEFNGKEVIAKSPYADDIYRSDLYNKMTLKRLVRELFLTVKINGEVVFENNPYN